MKHKHSKQLFWSSCVHKKYILKNFNDLEKDICFLFRGNKHYNESI